MATFSVNNDGLSIDADKFNDIAGIISAIQLELEGVQARIGYSLKKYNGIGKQLKHESQNIYKEFDSIRILSDSLKQISNKYSTSEIKIVQNASASEKVKGILQEKLNAIIGYQIDKRKTELDVLGKSGDVGKILSFPISLYKWGLDGGPDILHDPKSHVDILKGLFGTAEGISEFGKNYNKYIINPKEIDFKTFKDKFLGKDIYPEIVKDRTAAGWVGRMSNAKATFEKSFDKGLSIKDDAGNIKGFKVAGWALSFVANGISNYDEYKSTPGMTRERAVEETVSETFIDIGKGAVLTAGVAAASAALGFAAPAVVVGAGAVVASKVLDVVCTHLTGKDVTEAVSDLILDTEEQVAKVKVNAEKIVAKAASSWVNKVFKSVQNSASKVAFA